MPSFSYAISDKNYRFKALVTFLFAQSYIENPIRSNNVQKSFRPRLSQDYPIREGWRGSRNKLSSRQIGAFASAEPPLFAKIATAICSSALRLPRKELFEAWEVALRIDDAFPTADRIADLAAGHGLLGWLLLVLAVERGQPRTAVCVDRSMPLLADKVHNVMIQMWPELANCMHYVEGDLRYVEVDRSVLVTSVHACGPLTDFVLQCAVAGGAPVAVMPCCHSLENHILLPPEPGLTLSDLVNRANQTSAANALDLARIKALEAAGYKVVESTCDPQVTPYNRLFIAVRSLDASRLKHLRWEEVGWKKKKINKGHRIPLPLNDICAVAAVAGRKPFSSKRSFCFTALNPESSNLSEEVIVVLAQRASSIPLASSVNCKTMNFENTDDGSFECWVAADEVYRALHRLDSKDGIELIMQETPNVEVRCVDIYNFSDGRRSCTFEVTFTTAKRELTRAEVQEWRLRIYEALTWWSSNFHGGFEVNPLAPVQK